MHILLTNDDGIGAQGLRAMARALADLSETYPSLINQQSAAAPAPAAPAPAK